MTGPNGRSRGPFGPLEHLDEVQREIVDAALRVTAELSALAGDIGGAASDTRREPDRPPLDVGAIRTTVSRSMDMIVDVMHGLLDSGLDAIEQYQAGQRVRVEAQPGSMVALDELATLTRIDDPLVTPLADRNGRTLTPVVHGPAADAVAIPDDAPAGDFHGVVVSRHDDTSAVLLTVVITRP